MLVPVTCGIGLIGSHLLRRTVARGERAISYDSAPYAELELDFPTRANDT